MNKIINKELETMNKIKLPNKMNLLLAEEVGLHLGDGSMNYYNNKGLYQLRGHIIDDQEHYQLRIKWIYKKLFNIDLNLRKMPSCGVYGFQIWSNELVKFKEEFLGLPLGKKIEFGIPKEIIDNLGFSKSFLRGYFDTDGCLYLENKNGKPYPRVEMSTISQTFACQLNETLTKLGFKSSYYIEKRGKYGWQDLHRFIVRGDNMTKKWFDEIKPKNPKHNKKFSLIKLNKNVAPPRFELGTSR
jgi:intein/homing endonuclease